MSRHKKVERRKEIDRRRHRKDKNMKKRIKEAIAAARENKAHGGMHSSEHHSA
jgi:hypothetical protein